MKIAYFINQYPGISHSFIRREIQALERQGVDVRRFAIRPSKDQVISQEDFDENKKTKHIVSAGAGVLLKDMLLQMAATPIGALRALGIALAMGVRSEAGLLRHLFYWGEALVLAQWLRREDLRHVHAHFGTNATTIAMLAAPLTGAQFSFTPHGPEEFEKPALISLKRKIENAAFTAAISSFCASQLKKLSAPALWSRIKIVHCGLERSFYDAPEMAPPSSKPHFVCTGRLCAEKGQVDLVAAVAKVAKDHPDLRVKLIGDGPMRGDIEASIKEHGLADNVVLAGWKTPAEVRDALIDARGFILPSYAEGLPVSIMEALALKRPVITTYIAGIPELVSDGVCGWLTPAGDVDAIADALCSAITTDDETIASMGAEGRRRVEARHDIDTEATKLAAYFAEALQSQP